MSNPLLHALDTTSTTITVTGPILNAPQNGVIQIESEDVFFTHATDTQYLGCTRGFNSTSAASHAAGVLVTNITSNSKATIVELSGAGAPTDGVTGVNLAGIGSRYTNTSDGTLYINTGTGPAPVWNLVEAGVSPGITQLTGGVTAGPGSGSQAATVVSVGGVSAANVATAVTTANNALPKAGGTMTGDLTISEASIAKLKFQTPTYLGDIIVNEANGNFQLRLGGNPFLLFNGSEVRTTAYNVNTSGITLYGNGDSSLIGAGAPPPASSILAATSTTLGFLPPRMTNTQRDAIATPAEGLVIYSTSDHALEFYNGTSWKQVATV